jgi:hypothetical protein
VKARGHHVIRNPAGGWSVRKAGAARAARTFDTQAEAVSYARGLARQSGTELFVHSADGSVRERNTYGHDPRPQKG